MTILEQRFLELVPKQLYQIAKELERLNDFLERESSLTHFVTQED